MQELRAAHLREGEGGAEPRPHERLPRRGHRRGRPRRDRRRRDQLSRERAPHIQVRGRVNDKGTRITLNAA